MRHPQLALFLPAMLAWLLFGLGHAVSLVMDYWPWERCHPYRLYSALMIASASIQGGGPGPWETTT